jgi:hypothetical protein
MAVLGRTASVGGQQQHLSLPTRADTLLNYPDRLSATRRPGSQRFSAQIRI